MEVQTTNSLYLTFDTEDFISKNSVPALHRVLEVLKKHDLKGLFFITGSMAEKLVDYPSTVDMLNEHQIGYHSSGHSIHPTIFEFTDVKSFERACQVSLIREIAHISPFTGKLEGLGGILALRTLFPKRQITAFRAPGYCWSPPHTEALKSLGITSDFSTNLLNETVIFRGITFYPFAILPTNWQGGLREHCYLQRLVMSRQTCVLTIHPSTMVNQDDWDSIYYPKKPSSSPNPKVIMEPRSRTDLEISNSFRQFEILLRHLQSLQKLRLLRVTPPIETTKKVLKPTANEVSRCYNNSMKWAYGFNYKPKFLYKHFIHFFMNNPENTEAKVGFSFFPTSFDSEEMLSELPQANIY